MDIRDLFAIAWKRKLTVLAVLVVAVGSAAALASYRVPQYQATATLVFTPTSASTGLVGSDQMTTVLSTYAEAIPQSTEIRQAAVALLGHDLTAAISASSSAGTGILTISAQSASPSDAEQSANDVSTAFEQSSLISRSLLRVQIVSHATLPTTPVQPRPPLIIATGVVLGLGLGLALAFVLERWFVRIESSEDVRDAVGLPTLGEIPRNRKLRARDAATLVWDSTEMHGLHEAFRGLRTGLQFSARSSHDVVLVTSAQPAEGKSTIAANLAVAIASVGMPTLLVDSDFRAPRQHAIFDVPNHEGFSTLLAWPDTDLSELIADTRFANLELLPTGPTPPMPTELIAANGRQALAKLRGRHCAIVIDAPPVLAITDARLIAPQADAVVLVASVGVTRPKALSQALELLVSTRASVVGVVLNQAAESRFSYMAYRGYRPAHDQVRSERRSRERRDRDRLEREQSMRVAEPAQEPVLEPAAVERIRFPEQR